MSKRSVAIVLVNNTPFYLVHYWDAIPNGSWGPVSGTPQPGPSAQNSSLPAVIPPNSSTTWSSADSEFSIATGTEAWVKYSVLCQPPLAGANLLYFYWNNPYAWTSSAPSDYLDYCVAPSEGTFGNPYSNLPNGAPDQQQSATWPNGSTGSTTPAGLTGNYGVPAGMAITSVPLACELVPVSMTGPGNGPQGLNFGNAGSAVWTVAVDWFGLAVQLLIEAETDINFVDTFVLRQPGSVSQSIGQIYDPAQGLRALAVKNNKPSLRQLFGF
jgi:hypothetical protein